MRAIGNILQAVGAVLLLVAIAAIYIVPAWVVVHFVLKFW